MLLEISGARPSIDAELILRIKGNPERDGPPLTPAEIETYEQEAYRLYEFLYNNLGVTHMLPLLDKFISFGKKCGKIK